MHLSTRLLPLVVVAVVGVVALVRSGPGTHSIAAAADAPPAFECRWAATAPTIDGHGNDPAWTAAQVIDSFALPWLGKDARPVKEATRAKLLWDHDYLYFLAEMPDADLFADETKHDGQVWANDAFELFFRPAKDKPGYFEFEVNAAGTVLDAFFPKYDEKSLAKQIGMGEFRVEAKVQLRGTLNQRGDTDTGWTVEGRIPWADFLRTGGRPDVGEAWQFSLCRCNYHKEWKEPELSTTANIVRKGPGSFFHQIDDYRPVLFVGPGGERAALHGLGKLEPLTTSTVVGAPDPPPPFHVKRAYPDFRPSFPIMLKPIPGTDQLLLIAQAKSSSATILWRVKDDPAIKTADAVQVMITPDEGTATDFTFHPAFADNGFVYVGWNGKGEGKRKKKFCRVTRYTMDRKSFAMDPTSAKPIVEWESDGHNGLAVCFGTDGMLYVTSGDGTSDSDTDEMGQRPDGLLAKLLRLDVDHASPGRGYSVPKDNPFVADRRFAPETWAYGFRNPWRIACDEKTGHIWVGNNGQDLWEQAYFVRKGDNFGWSVTEGGHPFYTTRKAGPTPITKPAADHPHSEFRSLTGGIVYHGSRLPDLQGAYLYGDYSTGRIWGMKHDGTKPVWHKELARTVLKITAFATNTRGELLVLDHSPEGEGGIYALEPTPPQTAPSTFPRKLSESGLFESVKGHRMKPGVIPYSVNAPFWSDGMDKGRWMALPPGTQITYKANRSWDFPNKTVLIKSFAGESGQWVETRFLTKQDGEWFGYTYIWNAAGTDAELVPTAGVDRELMVDGRKLTWHYPSRAECMVCHSRAANFVLGLTGMQLNKDHDYGGCVDNQLRALQHAGVLKVDFTSEARNGVRERSAARGLKDTALNTYVAAHIPQAGQRAVTAASAAALMPRLPNPYDPQSADLTARAKAWIHTNCAQCHVEAGGGNAQMELEYHTPLDKMRILDVKPLHPAFDIQDARLIAPGDPDRSVLLRRAAARGPLQMPPLASVRPDDPGVALLREWIRSLPASTPAKVPKVAGITTEYRHNSHADMLLSRLIETDTLDGHGQRIPLELASVFTDQVPKADTSRKLARQYGFAIHRTVRDAMTLASGKLAVDGVLVIAEHGQYPKSDTGQTVYPKRRLLEQVFAEFDRSGRVVPVFCDKHLADNWTDAKWAYDAAKKRNVPLMAGSSVPGLWRYPPVNVTRGAKLQQIVGVSYHTLDAYGFHGLEAIQALAERRAGGETGVKRVQCLTGPAVWEAEKNGVYDRKLLDEALSRLKERPIPAGKRVEDLAKDPILFVIDYTDGLRACMFTLNGAVVEWTAAWRYADDKTASCVFWTQEARPFMHFTYQMRGIEQMVRTGQPAWPVERTLLTSGILDAGLISKRNGGQPTETPYLNVAYQSTWDWQQPPPPPPDRPIAGQ